MGIGLLEGGAAATTEGDEVEDEVPVLRTKNLAKAL